MFKRISLMDKMIAVLVVVVVLVLIGIMYLILNSMALGPIGAY